MLPNKKFQMKYKMLQVLLVLGLVFFMASGCARGYVSVVTYDGGKISANQFNKYLAVDKFFNGNDQSYAQREAYPDFKEYMLKQYVAFIKLAEKADEKTRKTSKSGAKDQLKKIKSTIKAQGHPAPNNELSAMIKPLKISETDIEKYIELQLNFVAVLNTKVTDEQAKAEYDKQIKANKYAYVDDVTVRHVLVALKDPKGKVLRTKEEALKRAKEAKAKLDGGADFAAVAKEYSDDGNKDTGGIYEHADPNQWVEPFKLAALELPINKISDPVETEFGYHVMKVESRNSNKFEDVKDKVRGTLIQAYFANYMAKEIPKIIKKISLPGTATAAPTAVPTRSPTAVPTVVPTAAPAK